MQLELREKILQLIKNIKIKFNKNMHIFAIKDKCTTTKLSTFISTNLNKNYLKKCGPFERYVKLRRVTQGDWINN